jgi:ankyrin repeat protein
VERHYDHGLDLFDDARGSGPKYWGHVLIHYLPGSPEEEVVKRILEQGADPNIPLQDGSSFQGTTALNWSVERPERLRLLVQAGARVRYELRQQTKGSLFQSCSDNCSVHQACRDGLLEALRILIEEAGGRAALEWYDDPYLHTPLMWASYAGHIEIVRYLLSLGVDPNFRLAESALDLAIQEGHTEVAELLRDAGAKG